ncbi:hypothetical protein DAEQUDRAFT_149004 [Daedalea quercina L-15889]|uniref:Uncharacterized protein n=1 Tax=Daedalea quercina L-15889 TaxID=1314783 RepID=A0A165KMD6_9APHY|nr:hypothetical protein DAEQUDRAFT_149004 [Daedalea quercina L-15889]
MLTSMSISAASCIPLNLFFYPFIVREGRALCRQVSYCMHYLDEQISQRSSPRPRFPTLDMFQHHAEPIRILDLAIQPPRVRKANQ